MTDTHAKNLQTLYEKLGDTQTDVRNKNLYALLLSQLKGKSLLDIGCGVGHFIFLAKQKGYAVEGVEPDKVLIEMSQQRYGNFGNIYNKNAEEIETIKNKYDTITLIDVLEHVEDDKGLLLRIKNLLNQGGHLIIFVPAYQFLFSKRDAAIGHYRRYYKSQLLQLLNSAGYETQNVRHWNMLGFFVYGIFEKILQKNTHHMRKPPKKRGLGSIFHAILDIWMSKVENKFNPGFGLSILVTATPKTGVKN